MKTSIHLLLASAALLIGVTSGQCAPGNSASINLTGTLASGKSFIDTSGTQTIKPAQVYHYAITGTCHGTGNFALVVPPGSDLDTVIGEVDSKLSPYLAGTVLNAPGTLPYVCVNKLATGSFNFFGQTITGQVRVDAGVNGAGVCYAQFQNMLFTVNGAPDTSDTIVIDNGKCLVSINPFAGPARPNMSFVSPTGHLDGIGSFGVGSPSHIEIANLATSGTATYSVVVENIGATAANFKLTATPAQTGFKQKFIYQTVDQTAAVTGAGLKIPPTGTLAGGDVATLTWQVINVNAKKGTPINPTLTATLIGGAGNHDALKVTGTSE